MPNFTKPLQLLFLLLFTAMLANAQAPVITSFLPKTGKQGAMVTITGTGFNATPANNIVFFGATRATVTAATATSLTVTVPRGATYAPVTELNTTTTLAAYSAANFTPVFAPVKTSLPANGFSPQQVFGTGANPATVAIADFDGDGWPDLATANTNDQTVSVLLNTGGSGTPGFGTATSVTIAAGITGLAIADIDGDGKPDLAVSSSETVTVLLNNTAATGSASFGAPRVFTAAGFPNAVAIADIDGDGRPDIATANFNANTVSVMLNTGSKGVIGFAPAVAFSTNTEPTALAIGDIDGDGKPDLAVANYNSGSASILLNTTTTSGSVSFAVKINVPVASYPGGIAIGDLNGDGKADLAVTNSGSGAVAVLLNAATGTGVVRFTKIYITTGAGPEGVAIGDINGDGIPDLAVANISDNTASVLLNGGTGTSFTPTTLAVGSNPTVVAIGDLDGDGMPDLAVANNGGNTVSVIRSIIPVVPPPTITSFAPLTGKPGTTVTITGTHFDATAPANNIVFFGATRATVTAATATSLTVTVPRRATYAPVTELNTTTTLAAYSAANFTPVFAPVKTTLPASGFAPQKVFSTGSGPGTVAIADFDGDGWPDLATANGNGQTVSVLLNTGSSGTPGFGTAISISMGAAAQGLTIADIDGDGKPDLIVSNGGANTVTVRLNTTTVAGSVSFSTPQAMATGNFPRSVAIADFDGDGRPDIATANIGANTVSVLLNTGRKGVISFAPAVPFATNANPGALAIGDIDGDGRPDLAVANESSASASILLNTATATGSVSFAAAVNVPTGPDPESIAIGDLNGDGKADLAVTNNGNNTVSVLLNTATGTGVASFTRTDFATGAGPVGVAIGDINGDGIPDLAVANTADNTISVLLNGGAGTSFTLTTLAAGSYPYSVAISDLDGDGLPDLAVANLFDNTVSFIRNIPPPLPSPPTITSFTPKTGKPGTTVTITGTHFDATAPANNIVFFGATRATVTAATATSITVTVPAGATYAPVTELNTTTTLAAYSAANFTPVFTPVKTTLSANGFAPQKTFGTGAFPTAVAIGDIDGDGWPDLVFADAFDMAVSVLLNTGASGTPGFGPETNINIGAYAHSVAIGDIDGDGKPDLVVGGSSGGVIVVLNTTVAAGAASFGAPAPFAAGNSSPAVAIADFDGDGRPDIAVTNSTANTVSVLLNIGSKGMVNFAPKADFATDQGPSAIAVGDIDGDGRPDLVTANRNASASVLLNSTTATAAVNFATAVNVPTSGQDQGIAVGDLNADGKADMAVTNSFGNTVSVLLNTTAGGTVSFAKTDMATGAGPAGVAIGDINGDGIPDLAVANANDNTTSVLLNGGTGTSFTLTTLATGSDPRSVAIGDLDGDGMPDLAVANLSGNTVSYIRNIIPMVPPPTITSFTPLTGKPGATVTITGTNFDASPANNIVFFGATRATVTAATATSLTVTVPAGATYAPVTELNTTTTLAAYSAANFTPVFAPVKTTLAANGFAPKKDFSTGAFSFLEDVTIGDLDGDGWPDLAMANEGHGTISVLLNTGSSGVPGFGPNTDIAVVGGVQGLAIGDMNGDGRPDLVVVPNGGSAVTVLLNTTTATGTVSFGTATPFATAGSGATNAVIADIDGDGRPDLVVPNYTGNSVAVLLNTGSKGVASFAPAANFATDAGPQRVAVADIDGDGKPDLVTANIFGGSVSILLNTTTATGAASFAAHVETAVGNQPSQIATGDLNGDGKTDLVVGNIGNFTVSVLLNTTTSGTVSFTKTDITTGSSRPNAVAIADLSGDGIPDLAIANLDYNTASVLLNAGDGIHFAQTSLATGNLPGGLAIGDLDGDGMPDLAVSSQSGNTVSYIRNIIPVVPPPTITSFTPLTGKPGTTVTITGTNFDASPANNIVFFGATRATVTAATATSLTVTVPAGATYAPVTELNTTTTLAAYSAANFTPVFAPVKTSLPASGFAPQQVFSTGASPVTVAIADIDGDGWPDLATANLGDQTVSVLLNTGGSGTPGFGTAISIPMGATVNSLAIADIDGDGKPDLIVPNGSANTVTVLLNTTTATGAVSFGTPQAMAAGNYPYSVAIADFDGDGRPDIATENFTANTVSVLLNTGSKGVIGFAPAVPFATNAYPIALAVGDIDGDGRPDLAVANLSSNSASILLNTTTATGSVSFAAAVDVPTGSYPKGIAIGDLNGDGKADLAVTNYGDNTVSVLLNAATGTGVASFTRTDIATGAAPVGVAFSDINGDGIPDLAVANTADNTASVLLNGGMGTGFTLTTLAAGNYAYSVAIGDLDGDGMPDLAVANESDYTVSVIRNIMPSLPPTITSFTPLTGKPGTTVTITGTNFDASPANNIVFFGATHATVTAATATSLTVTVPRGATYAHVTELNTTTTLAAYSAANFTPVFVPVKTTLAVNGFAPQKTFGTGANPDRVAIADIDGDGWPDLATANVGDNSVSVLLNTGASGTPGFGTAISIPMGANVAVLTIADIDGDGKPDLAVSSSLSNTVLVALNTTTAAGSVSFGTPQAMATGSYPYSVAIADLDGDGRPDIATANYTANTVSVLLNTGSKGVIGFAPAVTFATNTYPDALAIGDIDGDGRPDLVVANEISNSASILLNTTTATGSVSFAAAVDVPTGYYPKGIAIGDLNGDGKADLAVTNIGDNTVSALLNTATGTGVVSFTRTDFATGAGPAGVAIGDINGDGIPDLAVANATDNTISVLLNGGTGTNFTPTTLAAGNTDYSVAIGDLDGDGMPDLAVANQNGNTVSYIRNIIPVVPPPTITSFTPSTGKPGATVTITGTNFDATAPANNIVFFGATRATVTAATATSLTVTVPAGATYAPVTELNTTTTLAAYSAANFTPVFAPVKTTLPANGFAPQITLGTGATPTTVAIGDLDGDGWPDLAVANYADQTISVLLNTSSSGTPGFAAKSDITLSAGINGLAIGDIDGDGKQDLVTANSNDNAIIVLLNANTATGMVNFAAPVEYPTGNYPYAIAIADFDGDGKPDVATADVNGNTVSVLLNTGSKGVTGFAQPAPFTTGAGPIALAVGDIDGDGKPDLITANRTDNTISVVLNKTTVTGTANFATRVDVPTGNAPDGLATGDLNGDGKLDVAVANSSDNTVSVLLNTTGTGTVSFTRKDIPTGQAPNGVAISDMNGDGIPDLAIANHGDNTASVLLSAGDGINFTPTALTARYAPFGIAVGDLDGDGLPDLAVANQNNNSVSFIRNITILNTWTGATSHDWQDATNWSLGTVPISTDNVYIPVTANQPITGSTTATGQNFTIDAGAILTVTGSLEVTGNINNAGTVDATAGGITFNGIAAQTTTGALAVKNLTINNAAGVNLNESVRVYGIYTPTAGVLTTNGNLVLASTAISTASVAQSTLSNYVTGNVTVERYIPAHRAWRLLTAPLSNTGTIYQNWQDNGTADGSTGTNIWKPNGTGGSGDGFTAGGGEASIESYDPVANNWVGLSNTTSTLLSGTSASAANTGIGLFVTGPYGSNNILPTTVATATTLRAAGNLQTGQQQFVNSGLTAGTFMLVGNPYASPVDFTQVGINGAASGNITGDMWAWDAQRSNTSYGGYVTFSLDPATHTYDQDNAGGTTAQTLVIQSGEAFFVQAAGNGNATVTINETDKAAASAVTGGVFGVQPPATPAQQIRISLNSPDGPVDGVLAKFGDVYKAGTKDDAAKLFNYDENLSFRIDTNYLAIVRRPVPTAADTIFLDAYAMKKNTAYSFTVSPQNMPTGLQAWLVDGYTNTKTPLSMAGSTTVSFSTGTDAGSLSETRFTIVFQTNGVLATATTLKAVAAGKDVQVEWTTPNELGVKQYQLQRSTDGLSFTTINTATARNSGNKEVYDFTDVQPNAGDNYYRIEIFNADGTVTYSNVVLVKMARGAATFSIYPNPTARNGQVHVQFTNMAAGKYALVLYSTSGKQLMDETIQMDGTTATTLQTISLPQGIASGSYRIVLLDGNGGEWKQQLIVQ